MKMKYVFKKLLVSMLVILTLFNFIVSIGGPIGIVNAEPPGQSEAEAQTKKAQEKAEELIASRNNGITGILTWLLKILVIGIASTFQIETYFIANSAGGTSKSIFITPLDIFFNKFTLVDINIFSTTDANGTPLDTDGLVYKIRSNASMWYYIFRGVSLGILLIMLLYNGIRSIIANFADEKAKFKKIMVDWVVSIVLVMFIHMLIIFVININNLLVGIIEKAAGSAEIGNLMDSLMDTAFSENYLLGMAATIVYVIMIVQTLIYLFIYVKRFLTTLFLVIVSPLIPLTYSIDRADGGKAKLLNGWLREFLYNVFIQTIHCIIYVVMVGVAITALTGVSSISSLENLGAAIIAIFSIAFIRKAEELMREFFGFNNSTTLSSHKSVVNSAVRIGTTGAAMAIGGTPAALAVNGVTFNQNTTNNSTPQSGQPSLFGRVSDFFADKINYARTEQIDEVNGNVSVDGNSNSIINADNVEVVNAETPPLPGLAVGGMIALTDKLSDKTDDSVQSGMERLQNAITSTNTRNHTSTREHTSTDETSDSDNAKLEEIFKQLEEIESNYKALLNMKDEIANKLKDLDNMEKSFDANEAESIKKNLENLYNSSPEEAAQYANSLGDNILGDYARKYVDYLGDKQAYSDLDTELDSQRDSWIEQARANGMNIDGATEASILAGGSAALGALSQLRTAVNNSISEAADNDVSEEIETGDDVEEVTALSLPSEVRNVLNESTANQSAGEFLRNNRTVREETLDNLRMLEIFEGKAIIEGDITDESLTNFNVEILTKAKQGKYSESNFKAAEAKVKKEGEAAMRRLEAFKNSQSEANAQALTPAGKEYARLMVEAQQAGMVVASVKMMSEQTTRVDKNVTTMTQQTVTPSSRTNDVIGNLNNRRQAQG